jgi:hypothetical protein
LDIGAAKATAAVAQTLFKMASSGQCPAATIFWMKTRAGWRETNVVMHSGPEGGPIEFSHAKLNQKITEQLARLARPEDPETPGELQPARKTEDVLPDDDSGPLPGHAPDEVTDRLESDERSDTQQPKRSSD